MLPRRRLLNISEFLLMLLSYVHGANKDMKYLVLCLIIKSHLTDD